MCNNAHRYPLVIHLTNRLICQIGIPSFYCLSQIFDFLFQSPSLFLLRPHFFVGFFVYVHFGRQNPSDSRPTASGYRWVGEECDATTTPPATMPALLFLVAPSATTFFAVLATDSICIFWLSNAPIGQHFLMVGCKLSLDLQKTYGIVIVYQKSFCGRRRKSKRPTPLLTY